jgi:hypothetical protein
MRIAKAFMYAIGLVAYFGAAVFLIGVGTYYTIDDGHIWGWGIVAVGCVFWMLPVCYFLLTAPR